MNKLLIAAAESLEKKALARAPQMWLYNALNHGFAGVPKQSLINAFRGLLLDLATSPAN